jgi:small subunit ribosomal protein S21
MRYHKSKFQSDEKGVSVIRRDGEEIEALIRRFRKKVTKNGIYKDLKVKEFYEKPSIKKRRKRTEARKRMIKEQMKEIKRVNRNKKDDDK